MQFMALAVLRAILFAISILCMIVESHQVDQKSLHQLPMAHEPLDDQCPSIPSMMSFYDDEGGDSGKSERRSLYGHRRPLHHYISYGALSANRVPCPPCSGRSYYTNDCFRFRAPANPYTRGCSCISHCRR